MTLHREARVAERPAANGASAQPGGSATSGIATHIGGVGSLVIITGPEWDGREIEISNRDHDPRVRTQVVVRERREPDGVCHSAVFPALPAGAYVLWRTTTEPAGTVVVAPGTVTELEWWAHP